MKIFAVIIAILVLFISWTKPVNFEMTQQNKMENTFMQGTSLMFRGFEMVCGTDVCATVLAMEKTVSDCVRHCIQRALPVVGEIAAFVLAPHAHVSPIVFISLAGILVQAILAYVFIRYLLYAYTFFRLRFVTSTILRN